MAIATVIASCSMTKAWVAIATVEVVARPTSPCSPDSTTSRAAHWSAWDRYLVVLPAAVVLFLLLRRLLIGNLFTGRLLLT